jgi:hypothetical protein
MAVRDGLLDEPVSHARSPAQKCSPNGRNPATVSKSRKWLACLDIRALAAMFAQPSGSLSSIVRNIITKFLIVVVPRHTAGDG